MSSNPPSNRQAIEAASSSVPEEKFNQGGNPEHHENEDGQADETHPLHHAAAHHLMHGSDLLNRSMTASMEMVSDARRITWTRVSVLSSRVDMLRKGQVPAPPSIATAVKDRC